MHIYIDIDIDVVVGTAYRCMDINIWYGYECVCDYRCRYWYGYKFVELISLSYGLNVDIVK